MITREELEEYAKFRDIKNIGHAEKDYFQNVILFIVSKNYGKNFIFKGGTALQKCFGLDRFSEDLDFTCSEKPESNKLEEDLKRFKLEFEIEKKEYENGVNWTIRIRGPLYTGTKNSACKISLDLSLREKVILSPELKTIGRFLDEIPSFEILVMQEKEILSEKIRTILTRDKARDVYDLGFLFEKKIKFDEKLANEKLKYYNKKWHESSFIKCLNNKKNIWESEMKLLVKKVPNFNEIKKSILKGVK